MLTKIETDLAPAVLGPYSQAIDTGNLLFVSGQIGIDPKTGELPESFDVQAKNAMNNCKAILEKAGYGFDRVVKATIYLINMSDFAMINEIYGSYFTQHKPARACIEVAALPKGGKVEIELIAAK